MTHADILLDKSLSCCRNNSNFLPAAFVLGLQPGVPLTIPVTVVAEDDVTSQRYFISGTPQLHPIYTSPVPHLYRTYTPSIPHLHPI